MKLGRIIFVGPYRMQCGFATHIEGIEKYLDEDVMVLSEKLYGNKTEISQGKRKCIRCFDRSGNLDRLKQLTLNNRPVLVHIMYESGLFPDRQAFMDYVKGLYYNGIRVVLTVHTLMDAKYIVKLSDYCSRIIFNTESQLNSIPELYVRNRRNKFIVIPVGIPEPNKHPRRIAKKILGIPFYSRFILSTGFICPTKNLHSNINVISLLQQKYKNLYYMIAGMPQITTAGDENSKYIEKIRKSMSRPRMILDERYIMPNSISIYYSAADMIINNYQQILYPSGSGNALMPVGYGVPMICSQSKLLDNINEGICIRIPVDNDLALCKAIEQLLFDSQLRKSLHDNCLLKYKQQSWEKISEQHWNLYKECMERKIIVVR